MASFLRHCHPSSRNVNPNELTSLRRLGEPAVDADATTADPPRRTANFSKQPRYCEGARDDSTRRRALAVPKKNFCKSLLSHHAMHNVNRERAFYYVLGPTRWLRLGSRAREAACVSFRPCIR